MKTAEETIAARSRPRWRRAIRILLVGSAALLLIGLLAHTIWGYVEALRLDREIERIKAAGEPLTFEDLVAGQPEVSEADDAAPYYMAALALLRHGRETTDGWDALSEYDASLRKTPTSRPSGKATEVLGRFLADHASALEMLDRGARCPACRFDIGIERGIESCMERLSGARFAARLLSAQALARVAQGHADQAIDSLVCLLQLGRVFDQQPLMIAYLTKLACLSLACHDCDLVLEVAGPSDAALARLAAALRSADQPTMLTRMLLAERVYALQLTRDMIAGGCAAGRVEQATGRQAGQFPTAGFWSRPSFRRMTTGLLRDCAEFIKLSRGSLADAMKAMKGREPATSFLGRSLTAPMAKTLAIAARGTAETRCAALAVLIQQYRLAHGRLPGTLGELGPAIAGSLPTDPFTGKELFYRHDDRSFVVYSAGDNLADDGGNLERVKEQQPPPDIGVRVRLPVP